MTASPPRITVIGDAVLDVDIRGTTSRHIPGTKAPIVDVQEHEDRPGGAALAAVLGAGQSCSLTLVTGLSADPIGERLRHVVRGFGISVVDLGLTGSTPKKLRVFSDGNALVRADQGGGGRAGELNRAARDALFTADVVVVSDYGQGLVEVPSIRAAIDTLALTRPIVWDPHPRGSEPSPGATLVTPNVDEALIIVPPEGPNVQAVADRAAHLAQRWAAESVCITLGRWGVVLGSHGTDGLHIRCPPIEACDSRGAGDKFAIVAAHALARGLSVVGAAHEAVGAASEYVARGAKLDL